MTQSEVLQAPPPIDWELHTHVVGGVEFLLREPGPWNDERPWPVTAKEFGATQRMVRRGLDIRQERLALMPLDGLPSRTTIARWETGSTTNLPTAAKVLAVASVFANKADQHPDPASARGLVVEYLQAWVLLCHPDPFAEWNIARIEQCLVVRNLDLRRYARAVNRLLYLQNWVANYPAVDGGVVCKPVAGQHLTPAESTPTVRRASRHLSSVVPAAVEDFTRSAMWLPSAGTVTPAKQE